MNLKNRLSKLEKKKRRRSAEADCLCFPPDEPPSSELKAEAEAARAVLCPLHGERFRELAATIYRVIRLPPHLETDWRSWRSPQYIKAMDASFPPDRWPAQKIVEPDGTVRFVLKDGTEIHRLPSEPVYDYTSGELVGFLEGYQLSLELFPRLTAGVAVGSSRREHAKKAVGRGSGPSSSPDGQSRRGSIKWALMTLTGIFGGSGGPNGSLTMDAAGNLYGTTYSDGAHGYGSVFKVAPQHDGTWLLTDLYDFTGLDEGGCPIGSVAIDASGNLWGRASRGGDRTLCSHLGCGVVWRITP